jgi:orotidine-5'-phosphate decarboxylase
MDFKTKLATSVREHNSLLCVGLDSDLAKIPTHLHQRSDAQLDFNKAIIDATAEFVSAFKPNSAFYEAQGPPGIEQLQKTCAYIQEHHPHVPIILDAKRGDIGNTNAGYVQFAFGYLGVDAITIHPYLGREAVQPFLDCKDKGIIIMCRNSNSGAGEFQDLTADGAALYQKVATNVRDKWNANGNCLLVVGATVPDELTEVRKLVGDDMTFLVPGIGAQGGDIKATLKAGLTKDREGLIINSARGIIFASSDEDFAEAAAREAKKLRDTINAYR